jgi:hypothetical protein
MTASVTYPAGDTSPSIYGTITNPDGTKYDLTGKTVRFQMRWTLDNRFKIDAAAAIVAPTTDGYVRYDLETGDMDTPGEYESRWQILNSDNTIEHTQPADTIEVVRL